MFKRIISVALLLGATPVIAQTASQTVPGTYATAPQAGCTVGPCYLPNSSTNPIHVTTDGASGGSVTLSPSATVGLTTQSCSTACASTNISGAHALYNVSFSSTVSGWLLIYDTTTCPANGTVTPKKAVAYTVPNTTVGFSWGSIPVVDSTGISACFSTTGPYTAASSATAFISLDYK